MSATNLQAPPGRLGTVAAAAERIDAHPKTVRRMIARGQLTAYRLPGARSIRVDMDELEAMLRPVPTTAGGAATGSRPVEKRRESPATHRDSGSGSAPRASQVPDEAA